ncbi:MAG: fused MFS/spermidine synthase [Paracoccaceae bacterium]
MLRYGVLVMVQAMVAAASLVVEIVAGRMLAPYVGMSLYTWTSIIAVVLAGFSVGHWIGGRIAEKEPQSALTWNGWSMIAAAVTVAGAVFILRVVAGPVLETVVNPVASIILLTVFVFFLPSLFAGIPAPILAMIAVRRYPDHQGRVLGALFAAGAWGAILGTLAAGFVFISWLGTIGTLVVVCVVYCALAAHSFLAAGRAGALASSVVPALIAAFAIGTPNPCTVESQYFCIRVIDEGSERLMVLDHLVHGIAVRDDPLAMANPHGLMLDSLPRLRMQGQDRWSAFFIGGGSYSVPRAWAQNPAISVTVAEIDPLVTETARQSFWYEPGTHRIVHEDARRVLASEAMLYDVIVGDAFGDIAVPQHLITREFFELVNQRLEPGGIYVMNVIDQMGSWRVLGSMVQTARQVWPSVEVWADPAHDPAADRRVFVIVAGDAPSAASQVRQTGPYAARAVRVSAESVDTIVQQGRAMIFTDDFAPIDRLLSDTGES